MESKPFPVSESKLERLRSEGVVPFSRDVLALGVVLGLIVGFWLLRTELGEVLLDYSKGVFSADVPQFDTESAKISERIKVELRQAFDTGFMILLSFALPVLLLVLVLGLLQTKFLISMTALKPDLGRLFSMDGFSPAAFVTRFLESSLRCVKAIAWIVVSLLFLRYVLHDADLWSAAKEVISQNPVSQDMGVGVTSLEQAVTGRAVTAGGALQVLLLASLGFAFFIGLASYFLSYFQFHRLHRMSRAEVEEEYREMEAAPELRSAQREFHQE